MPQLDRLLHRLIKDDGSDLHMSVCSPPRIRTSGTILDIEDEAEITADDMEIYLSEICDKDQWSHFKTHRDLDLAYELPNGFRFRGSFFYNHWGIAAVFRTIPAEIISFEKLGLPDSIKTFCTAREGLIFVTGPTGSGKSTTLASMIDLINRTEQKHIITIEDPIEFVHNNKQSVIVHREVGIHSKSFANALRGAMRADPDILLIGEMRDLETIRLALNCASMGMLVFGTLHTNNAPMTIDRVIDAFPADEQNQVRTMLGACLNGVVSQLLCKKVGGGRVAAHEILTKHDALPNAIRSGKISKISGIIENGTQDGMTTMDGSLQRLFNSNTISAEEAYMKAANKDVFKKYLDQASAKPSEH